MKTKYYDKEIYARNESIKSILLVIVCFVVGFAVGCMAINDDLQMKNADLEKGNKEKQEHIVELERLVEEQQVKINEQYVELDSLRETIYMYNLYGE